MGVRKKILHEKTFIHVEISYGSKTFSNTSLRSFGQISRYLNTPDPFNSYCKIVTRAKGGVHISKLAYEDLTWENSSDPESFAPWYTMIMGHYTPCST